MDADRPTPFPYAVASFDPDATSVLLWTRVVGPGELRWEVATDQGFTDVVREGTADPDPVRHAAPAEVDGTEVGGPGGDRQESTCVVTVDGLPPGSTLYYRFHRGEEVSPVGRTRTLPDDDRPVRLGLACCGDYSAGHFGVYRALADQEVDLVVHLGDYVYAEAHADVRDVDPAHDAVTRADYDARYRQVRLDPDLQALHLRHPMAAVIDDHDLADNAARDGAKTHDEAEHGPWAERLAAALDARAEWVPIRPDGPRGRRAPAQWRAVPLGALGELVLLDTRLDDRDLPPDVGGPDVEDRARTMLGGAQAAWVEERLADRSRPWCLVVSSVVLSPITITLPVEATVNDVFPDGYLVTDGVAINTDGWDGYPAERERLAAAMAARGRGAVVLSGDVHSSWAFEGPTVGERAVAIEFTCPATTSTPMGEAIPVVGGLVERLLESDGRVRWVDLQHRGHLVVDVDATSVTGTWWFTDAEDPAARAEPAARWVAHLDRPGRLEEVPAPATTHDGEAADGTADRRSAGSAGHGPGAGDRGVPVPGRPASLRARLDRRDRVRRIAAAAVAALVAVEAVRRRHAAGGRRS